MPADSAVTGAMIRRAMTVRVPSTTTLQAPSALVPSAAQVIAGPPIAPIDRVKLYDGDQWEQFVLEWADSLRDRVKVQGDVAQAEGRAEEWARRAETAEAELERARQAAAPVEQRRREELDRLRRTRSLAEHRRELRTRFSLLATQYESDLERLALIEQAGGRLEQLTEERCQSAGRQPYTKTTTTGATTSKHATLRSHAPESGPRSCASRSSPWPAPVAIAPSPCRTTARRT